MNVYYINCVANDTMLYGINTSSEQSFIRAQPQPLKCLLVHTKHITHIQSNTQNTNEYSWPCDISLVIRPRDFLKRRIWCIVVVLMLMLLFNSLSLSLCVCVSLLGSILPCPVLSCPILLCYAVRLMLLLLLLQLSLLILLLLFCFTNNTTIFLMIFFFGSSVHLCFHTVHTQYFACLPFNSHFKDEQIKQSAFVCNNLLKRKYIVFPIWFWCVYTALLSSHRRSEPFQKLEVYKGFCLQTWFVQSRLNQHFSR